MRRTPVSIRTVVAIHPDSSGAMRRLIANHNPFAYHASGEKSDGDDHGKDQFGHSWNVMFSFPLESVLLRRSQ